MGKFFKNIVFPSFYSSFRLDGGNMSQNDEKGGVLMFQGQIGKIVPESPGKSGVFHVLALFFHLSLPKIWQSRAHENYIFKMNKDRSIVSKNFKLLS